jgi:hypothetical protein
MTVRRDIRVSESSPPLEPTSPQNGDIVVAREAQSRVHYTVRQLPGIVQFSTAVRDDAVALARGFGRHCAVDVWYKEPGGCRLIEAFRPRPSTRRRGDVNDNASAVEAKHEVRRSRA